MASRSYELNWIIADTVHLRFCKCATYNQAIQLYFPFSTLRPYKYENRIKYQLLGQGYGHFSEDSPGHLTLQATGWCDRFLWGLDSRGTLLKSIAKPSYIPLPCLAILPKNARFNHICVRLLLNALSMQRLDSGVESSSRAWSSYLYKL